MTSEDETLWALRAQCGDREALELLLRSVQPALYRYVRRVTGPADADDVLQDTLVSIARNVVWLVEPRLFRAWAFRIASRAAFSHLRRVRRRGVEDSAEMVLASLPANDPPPRQELLTELLDSDVLSPASRAVLVLHFQEEMGLADVAAVLEIPLGTVKSRLAYGLKTLRRYLEEKRN
ncbi:MAG TPA: RNA polymerase sigma factor [Vicinamibacterales bacterium]|nr:RNA polymerase sigma factor [Vicinamibacterales bacterium]